MTTFKNMNTNVLIAMLRGLTHEVDRVSAKLDDPELSPELMEELNLYSDDLENAISLLMDEYEKHRNLPEHAGRLTEISLLLNYFSSENVL